MTLRKVVIALALGTLALFDHSLPPAKASVDALPYFAGPDLTPLWLTPSEVDASLHRVGHFDLVDQTGARFTDADVAGHVHVVSFFFTSCAGICPQLISRLETLQRALLPDQDVLMVSFSVDPLHDSPARLAAFGAERGIDPHRWRLLTGPVHDVYAAARGSYFADDAGPDADETTFLHTERVLLVDAQGHIRGVYSGTLPLDIRRLAQDVDRLLTS